MTQTHAAIIAAAWAQEREKYTLYRYTDGTWELHLNGENDTSTILLEFDHAACQAHLDQLCAAAVERALADAGYVIVPREPTGAMLSAGFDARAGFEDAIYRAMLAAAPEGER